MYYKIQVYDKKLNENTKAHSLKKMKTKLKLQLQENKS
jgi:hypothetical protein